MHLHKAISFFFFIWASKKGKGWKTLAGLWINESDPNKLGFFSYKKLFSIEGHLTIIITIHNVNLTGGGRNVDDQNVDRPKISERRNGLFS